MSRRDSARRPVDRTEVLRADLDATLAYWRHLVDVRFRLLGLVPTVTGIGLAALAGASAGTRLGVGLIGLVATLGVLSYELRNSMLHDAAVHRVKHLERLLGFPPSIDGRQDGGVFTERPSSLRRGPIGLPVKHDTGLAIVYASAIGGWVALTVSALGAGEPLAGGAVVVGAAAAAAVVARLRAFDERDRRLPAAPVPPVT